MWNIHDKYLGSVASAKAEPSDLSIHERGLIDSKET
jgi:hypothetical protein